MAHRSSDVSPRWKDSNTWTKSVEDHKCSLPENNQKLYAVDQLLEFGWFTRLRLLNPKDPRANQMFRSQASINLEKYRHYSLHRKSIHPYSTLSVLWHTVIFFAITFDIFESNRIILSHNERHSFLHEISALYGFHVIVSCMTGYVKDDNIELSIKSIILSKIKKPYTLDFYIALRFIIKYLNLYIKYRTVRMTCVWVVTKLALAILSTMYLRELLTVLGLRPIHATVIEFAYACCMYAHGCILMFFISEFMFYDTFDIDMLPSNSWLRTPALRNGTTMTKYTKCLFKSVSLLRQGSTFDMFCTHRYAHVCDCFFACQWTVSMVLYYYYVFTIVALMTGTNLKLTYSRMLTQLQNYMTFKRIPIPIRTKITTYFHLRHHSSHMVIKELMTNVSGQLKEDILVDVSMRLLKDIKLLNAVPKALRVQIALALTLEVYLPGDVIQRLGSAGAGERMYFIDRGTVAVYSAEGTEVAHLEDGNYFGEIAIFLGKSFITVVAETNCELLALTKADFVRSFGSYPSIYERLREEAVRRKVFYTAEDQRHSTHSDF